LYFFKEIIMSQCFVMGSGDTSIILNIYYSKNIDINYIGANLSKDVKKIEVAKKRRKKVILGFYLVAHQTHTPAAPCSAAPTLHLPRSAAQARSFRADLLLLPPLALRLGPRDRSGSPSAASI